MLRVEYIVCLEGYSWVSTFFKALHLGTLGGTWNSGFRNFFPGVSKLQVGQQLFVKMYPTDLARSPPSPCISFSARSSFWLHSSILSSRSFFFFVMAANSSFRACRYKGFHVYIVLFFTAFYRLSYTVI